MHSPQAATEAEMAVTEDDLADEKAKVAEARQVALAVAWIKTATDASMRKN
jgi:hypothetical protein